MDLEKIKLMVSNGERVPTGKKDINGKELFLGDHLLSICYGAVTYEIRIRNEKFVQHTGGSYSELTDISSKKCILQPNVDFDLGMGSGAFNSKLIC